MEKGSRGKFPIHDDIGRETDAQTFASPTQQTLPGGIYKFTCSIGLDIKRERQPRPYHTGQDHMVPITGNLLVRIPVRTAERTTRARAPSHSSSIHGQADATAAFESLVALGLVQHVRQGRPRESGI